LRFGGRRYLRECRLTEDVLIICRCRLSLCH
jgi:hypothetical protein